MNKISKKIVALATMAAFVLTLVPVAAFAAVPGGSAQIDRSSYGVVENNKISATANVDAGDELTTQFILKDADGDGTQDTISNLYIWATNNDTDETTSALVVEKVGTAPEAEVVAGTTDQSLVYALDGAVASGAQYKVSFKVGGEYTLHAGYAQTAPANMTDINNMRELLGKTVVTVDQETVVDHMTLYYDGAAGQSPKEVVFDSDNITGDLDLLNLDNVKFAANGSDKMTVAGYAYEKNGTPAVNAEIKLTSGKPDILWFDGDAADGVVTTDENGYFEFQFKMKDNRNVPVTITANDVKYTLKVIKEESKAYDIDTTNDNGYVLAGADDNWDGSETVRSFSDAVQFSISTVNGEAITGPLNDEPAWNNADEDHARFIDVVEKPTKSTLDAWKLVLVEDGDSYTLKYVGNDKDEAEKDLVPGHYAVTVSLLSGDYATAEFNVAKFGTVEDIVLDINAKDLSSGRQTNVTDEITLGQDVTVVAKFVDENGLKIAAGNDAVIGGYGKAVVDDKVGANFVTKADVAANESLLGTTVTVIGYSDKYGVDTMVELTVVDSYNAFTLEFDPAEGAVNKDNKVTVKVVDEEGDLAQVDGDLKVYVADQSNEDATVTAEVVKDNPAVKDGKGQIIVYASEPTTVELAVAVVDKYNSGVYVGHLDYAVGADQLLAHHNVVMTIGSSEYVVDKQLFTMDAAPYVDSNWRTMVPIRALAEAFDATVTYDNDDRTVTIEYDKETIVMTIDESAYTINGEEAEMDTEAVIKGDRTYVPVRFAAEAMGFTVTALYDENSSTASVVFQS